LDLVARGKVRVVYRLGEGFLLVATDRISAFDVVMKSPIPDKGKILTQLSLFWFQLLGDVCPNHLITTDVKHMPDAAQPYASQLVGRSMYVERLDVLQVEAVVRGYLSGSGWKEYRQHGTVCEIVLPKGLQESARLDKPLYTPATKAPAGQHDENIHPSRAAEIIGEHAATVERLAVSLYSRARDHAAKRGIIIADTKFEFGRIGDELILIDEVLTPDSSRFWPADEYKSGRGQPSFDKQFVRDWLETTDWDKNSPPPPLPDDVVARSREKYIEAYERITGLKFVL
jgi:phosphoribosylaminoimidazole-succinocarboxamide synthase